MLPGLGAFVAPYLQRGELRMVAEATPAELDACRRLLPGLADLFQVLAVPSFDDEKARRCLHKVAETERGGRGIAPESGMVEATVRLFRRFSPYGAFPGQASAFLRKLFEGAADRGAASVTLSEAIRAFVDRTGLPEVFLRDDLPLREEEALGAFRKEVIGQEAACRAAADLVLTIKAGLNDPKRPLGVLLFCGPTGVGKTELARAIARFLFGSGTRAEDRLVRVDLSEYAAPGSAARLIEGPGGEPSDIIRRVRRQPFSVVLLDEVEKADPGVFDLLLGVFDEGRLMDPFGRVTSFSSSVIIMTSNLGASSRDSIGFGAEAGPSYEDEALSFFRPELFNRIDAVVSFGPLGPGAVRSIAAKELSAIAEREGLAKANLHLSWTEAVIDRAVAAGFDRRYGARPLQRALEGLVVTPLARLLVARPGLRDREILADIGPSGEAVLSVR